MSTAPARAVPGRPAIIARPPVAPVTRVVVGTDGSAGSSAAVRWAAAEACRLQVLLRIVSAWEQPDLDTAGDPAQIAAARVQQALARVLDQQRFPHRVGCATPRGAAGKTLLDEAGQAGLLVLGAAAWASAPDPGTTGRYCLDRGRGPLVFVPARPGP